MSTASSSEQTTRFVGNDKVLFGIILGVLAFWLFAQTTLNIAPVMAEDLGVETSIMNIAVSITALFSGIFIVVMGGLAVTKLGLSIQYLGISSRRLGTCWPSRRNLSDVRQNSPRPLLGCDHVLQSRPCTSLLGRPGKAAGHQPLVDGLVGRIRFCRAVRRVDGAKRRLALDLLRLGRLVTPWYAPRTRHSGEQGRIG